MKWKGAGPQNPTPTAFYLLIRIEGKQTTKKYLFCPTEKDNSMITNNAQNVNKESYTTTKNISIYRNSYDTKGTLTDIDNIYKRISKGGKGLAQKTKKARKLASKDERLYKKFKESALPAPAFAGIFPSNKRQADHLQQHSGYIVFDIDDLPSLTLYALIEYLKRRNDIVLAFLSPSGTGLKLVVRVTPTPQDHKEHKAAYKSVIDHFADIAAQFHFTFDKGNDCNRLCYLAHDRDVLYVPDATAIEWDRDRYLEIQAELQENQSTDFDTGNIDITALDYIDPDNAPIEDEDGHPITHYNVWIGVGMACHNSGLPFDVWDQWSQQGQKYNQAEMRYKWESFGNRTDGQLTWATVIHWAKQGGYVPTSRSRNTKAPLLQIDTAQTEKRKSELTPKKDVETELDAVIRKFIESPKTETPQFTILSHDTGTGKSTTNLARAYGAGKKVLSLLGNHSLAEQQTHTASEIGFIAYRFRGRGHNFDDTNLGSLPVAMREQDETLFDKYNVMCPIYDSIKKMTDKRITPIYTCLNCPLFNTCKKKGYWSQYIQIFKATYLCVCLQDLPFNPDLWAFLNTIMSGKIPFEPDTETETPEETAIAAKLGLGTNAAKDTNNKPFDFAMIDDYNISELYIDVTYTIKELADLMRAWHGTETGEVIETIYKAIWELHKHQKDENTQPAMAILRELFEELDQEKRDRINENLTQHAHRHPDGEIEPMSPLSALLSGIRLVDITPVWHSKDWTLIHQLEAMLSFCQNDAQAPIFSLITKDTAQVTFTIPPQIHPQLNKVLFVSATADIEGTQAAFTGKDVEWTIPSVKRPQLADGVKLYQYVDSRVTASSIFEQSNDAKGNIVYDENGKPMRTGQLTNRAKEILQKITTLVKEDSNKSLFTSYKEFTDGEFTELETIKQLHDAFDTITHYDIAQGRNFHDYKVFINFGYPKIQLSTIKNEARRQYAHDPNPLCFDYDKTTDTENGYISTAGRFLDQRVENIRQQFTTLKLKQTIGRARINRWKNTIVLCITNEPIPGFTELATPLTYKQLMQAPLLDDMDIEKSITAEIKTEKPTTADKVVYLKQQHPQITQSEIAQNLNISQQAVSKHLTKAHRDWDERECNNLQPSDTIPIVINSCTSSRKLCNVTLREQILNMLSRGEAKTSEIIEAVHGKPYSVKNEMRRLVQVGEIVKVRYGIYALPNPIKQEVTKPIDIELEKTNIEYPEIQPPLPILDISENIRLLELKIKIERFAADWGPKEVAANYNQRNNYHFDIFSD